MRDPLEHSDLPDTARESIARALQVGGAVSFTLLAAGLVLSRFGETGRAGDITIRAGILALLATPVSRILMAAWQFAKLGNRRYLGLSILSLLVIAASIAAGLAGRQ